jgi:membrane protein YqaA with SNARE-associated domain
MRRTDFVFETTDELRTRLFTLAIVGSLAILGLIAVWLFSAAGIQLPSIGEALRVLISGERASPMTLMIAAMLGGLFFLPIPIEAAYLVTVRAGSPPVLSALAVLGGLVVGHSVSYLIGWKLSRTVSSLVSSKKMYALRRKVNKYGSYAIFGINVIPAPSPILTFALGIARYNMLRLFSLFLLGNAVKFGVLAGMFLLL